MNRGKENLNYFLGVGFFGVCLFYIEPLSESTDFFFFFLSCLAQFSQNLPFQNNCLGVNKYNSQFALKIFTCFTLLEKKQ